MSLIELPEQLVRLTQLRELDLESNRIRSLPGALANLRQLEELKLAYNELSDLPDAIVEWIRSYRVILA